MKNEDSSVIFHNHHDLCRMISKEMLLRNGLGKWISRARSEGFKDTLLRYLNVTRRNLKKDQLLYPGAGIRTTQLKINI